MFDGPWKESPEEALKAFEAKMLKNNLNQAFRVFVAVSDETTQDNKDSKGVTYNVFRPTQPLLSDKVSLNFIRFPMHAGV